MSTIILQETMRIPDSVVDLDSFREWAKSDEFPDPVGNPEFTLASL